MVHATKGIGPSSPPLPVQPPAFGNSACWVGLGWVGSGLVVRAGLTGFIFSPDRTVPSLLFSGLGLGLGQEHLFSDTIPEDQRQTTCHVEDDVIVNQF